MEMVLIPKEVTNIDRFCMDLALHTRLESPCKRTKVGATLVMEDLLCISNSNGNKLCSQTRCLRARVKSGENLEECRGVHAEQKVLLAANMKIKNCLYVTHFPCASCARAIIYAGVSEVVYLNDWGDMTVPLKLFKESKVTVRHFNERTE